MQFIKEAKKLILPVNRIFLMCESSCNFAKLYKKNENIELGLEYTYI